MEESIRSIYSCWNAGDHQSVIKAFRALGPDGFTVEYVGSAPIEGEAAVQQMWDEFAGTCTVEISELLVNGDEAAAFILNQMHGEDRTTTLPSIETHHVPGQTLDVRDFHRSPT